MKQCWIWLIQIRRDCNQKTCVGANTFEDVDKALEKGFLDKGKGKFNLSKYFD